MSNAFNKKRKLSQTSWMDSEIEEIDEQLEDQQFDDSLQTTIQESPSVSLESSQRKAITEDVTISIPLTRPTLVPLPRLVPK
jgi:hypothetical protein